MSRERIERAGDAAALRLPRQVLEDLGLGIGDEVELSVTEGALIVRSINEVERAGMIEDASNAVFKMRITAYEELAKGVD